jgi:hypothetical protein
VPVAWDVTVAPDRLKVSFCTTVEEEVEEPTEVTELAILFPLIKTFKNPTSGNLVLVSHQLFVCLLKRCVTVTIAITKHINLNFFKLNVLVA